MYNEVKRPVIVTLLAVIHFIIGGIFIYLTLEMIVLYILFKVLPSVSISTLIPQIFLVVSSDYTFTVSILFYGVISYISIYTGYGLWRGVKWIYYFELGLVLVLSLNILFIILITGNILLTLLILIALMILFQWRKQNIIRYFKLI